MRSGRAGRYTSARLNSRDAWTYGRIEVRAKLPRGRGTWPAIWMLPLRGTYAKGGWPDNGEIDIMEHVGFDPNVVLASVHTRAYNHVDRTQRTERVTVPGAQDDFHVYAVEWTARSAPTWTTVRISRFATSGRRTPGGLASLAIRSRLPPPAEHCGWRELGWSERRGRRHLAAADGNRLRARAAAGDEVNSRRPPPAWHSADDGRGPAGELSRAAAGGSTPTRQPNTLEIGR